MQQITNQGVLFLLKRHVLSDDDVVFVTKWLVGDDLIHEFFGAGEGVVLYGSQNLRFTSSSSRAH